MKLYCFPGPETRQRIDTAIQLYASGRWSRQKTMTYIAGILDAYGVTRLRVRNYVVRKVEAVTVDWPYPVVIVESQEEVFDQCPACGSDDYKYLAGEAPAIKTWCMSCGCVYQKEVQNEETGSSV